MTYVTGLVNFRMYYPTWLNNVLRQSGDIRDYLRKLLVLNLILLYTYFQFKLRLVCRKLTFGFRTF